MRGWSKLTARALSCSFIMVFVLFGLLFEELNAAKPCQVDVPIDLSTRVVNDVIQATVLVQNAQGEHAVKVLDLLLMFYQTNPDVFQLILNIYNSYKPGRIGETVIPANVLNNLPDNIQLIIFTKYGNFFTLNSTIFSVLNLLKQSIKDGIDAGRAWWRKFREKEVPKLLLLTKELVSLALCQIIEAAATIGTSSKKTLRILIPDDVLEFEY